MAYIFGQGTKTDKNSICLCTRAGNPIENERKKEQNPVVLAEGHRIHKGNFPQIEQRRLSATYNCGGHVFGVRRTNIDSDSFSKILSEDGYDVIEESKVAVGDLVLYKDNGKFTHVGVVTETINGFGKREIKVLSKWGQDGEYFHPVKIVPPLYGSQHEFWSDRRTA